MHRSTASTILAADASDGAEADDSSSSDDDSSSESKASLLPSEEESDILSSPTFLKRKVEVLQSDIAALEKEIEEANAVAAKGKEEWAAKFDMLTKEVRNVRAKCAIVSWYLYRFIEFLNGVDIHRILYQNMFCLLTIHPCLHTLTLSPILVLSLSSRKGCKIG